MTGKFPSPTRRSMPLKLDQLTAREIAKFWSRVDKREPEECWPWKRHCSPKGYGVVWVNSGSYRAHRVSYLLANGRLPDALIILHRCDNPRCVNPAHLKAGTVSDNSRDASLKGRLHGPSVSLLGERGTNAKLRDADIPLIRALLSQRVGKSEIARRYGVSHSTIKLIEKGETWKHIK